MARPAAPLDRPGAVAVNHAMVLDAPGRPLRPVTLPVPQPGPRQILVRILACGVCRTDLHVVDGELPSTGHPVIPGHQVVGLVAARGADATRFAVGARIGVPWLGGSCGACEFCLSGRENLCDEPRYTGYDLDGGFAEWCLADERYTFPLPAGYGDLEAAPLLCAGMIGWRALRMAGPGRRLGLFGFGAAAHVVIQLARRDAREVFAFVRPGDEEGRRFALAHGAVWAGDSTLPPPAPLDAAIIFAPVGTLVPLALTAVKKGGIVVCAGIHMSELPAMPYRLLWGERVLRSVANLTRRDGEEFLALVPELRIGTTVRPYPLAQANEALADLRVGRITGAAVLMIDAPG